MEVGRSAFGKVPVGNHPDGEDRRGEPVRQPLADADHAAAASGDGSVPARGDSDEPAVLRLSEPAAPARAIGPYRRR
jgi:hypothetical protein